MACMVAVKGRKNNIFNPKNKIVGRKKILLFYEKILYSCIQK